MTLFKNQILAIIFTGILLLALPVGIFLSQKRQDIRPKAVDITPTPTITIGIPQTTATISDNFDGGSLDTGKWKIYSNNPQIATGSAIKQENGVLRFTIPSGLTSYTGITADYKDKITGDYEASADVTLEQGGDPYGADSMIIMHDDTWDNGLLLTLRKETGGIYKLYALNKINGVHNEVKVVTIASNGPVTLQIKRIGTSGDFYYKLGNGSLTQIASVPNVYAGNGTLALTINSWEPNFPAITSTFDNFSAKVNFLSVSGPTLTPTPTPIPCLTLPQSDNFIGSTISAQLWKLWSHQAGTVNQTGGVLKTSMPGNVAGFAGLLTMDKVCGDFDVRVDFSQFTSSGQAEGHVVMIILDESNNSEVRIQRYSKGNEQGFWTDMKKPDGTYFGGTAATSTTTTGILRIRRQGSVFTTYYDDGSSWKKLGYYPSGFSSDANIVIGVGSWTQNPSVSANFDNFNLTNAILDPSITPVPSATPTPTLSPTPTPPSGREKYIIDAGDKQSLSINIGPSINPLIKFKAKLSSLRSYPELYLKLRVKDELAFLSNQNTTTAPTDTCNNPKDPDKDFLIPMKATGDVYNPVQQISQPVPTGATVASVTNEGWVILDGVIPGRYYSLFLKGPKTRKGKMAEHFLLQPEKNSTQEFDWTGKPLDPGDLPDPNNGDKQDCTINSTDWSLEKSRIGANDGGNLAVCDVNYDSICNAGDSVAILNTLSKRPDDDF